MSSRRIQHHRCFMSLGCHNDWLSVHFTRCSQLCLYFCAMISLVTSPSNGISYSFCVDVCLERGKILSGEEETWSNFLLSVEQMYLKFRSWKSHNRNLDGWPTVWFGLNKYDLLFCCYVWLPASFNGLFLQRDLQNIQDMPQPGHCGVSPTHD